MSTLIRRSNRVALAIFVGIGLFGAQAGVIKSAHAQSPSVLSINKTKVAIPQSTLAIGPIDGLTSSWYLAPSVTSIPLGTYLQLHQPASANEVVAWTGANEIARDDQGSTAGCWLLQPGPHIVRVNVSDGSVRNLAQKSTSTCVLNVVNIPLDQITVSMTDVWVDAVEIDESLPQDQLNELTMDHFFGLSIAALRDLGDSRYRTSVDRLIHMTVVVDPPGFTPLMEWRVDGNARQIGASTTTWFTDVGNHLAEVGPLLNPEQIEIETYSVTITSHTSGEDIIPEGMPIVFTAETNPPGYENEITWLSSTMYGTAEPILSEGPIFIAEFNDTWGPWPEDPDVPFQWLGVKADNVAFNQDQKMCACLGVGINLNQPPIPPTTICCDEMGGGSQGYVAIVTINNPGNPENLTFEVLEQDAFFDDVLLSGPLECPQTNGPMIFQVGFVLHCAPDCDVSGGPGPGGVEGGEDKGAIFVRIKRGETVLCNSLPPVSILCDTDACP